MQEIINYTIAIFNFLVTPYGIVAFLILSGSYAAYLFILEVFPVDIKICRGRIYRQNSVSKASIETDIRDYSAIRK